MSMSWLFAKHSSDRENDEKATMRGKKRDNDD
jgi:hypothetical protein